MSDRFAWLDELPTKPGPPDLKMGLRSLAESDWLLVDELTAHELVMRAELYEADPATVMCTPAGEEASAELLELVEQFTGTTGRTDIHPLAAASLLTPEDLHLVLDGTLVAGSLFFPNEWALADKIGKSLIDVHEPTEGYAEHLGAKVDSFFARLQVGNLVWRRNWFLHDIDDYVQPVAREHRAIESVDDIEPLFVRSERETLRRLPRTGAVVFTIKTQIAPIAEVRARRPVATALADFLDEASPLALRGKDAAGREQAVIKYLRGG